MDDELYGQMLYGTLPPDTQDFQAVLRGIGRTLADKGRAAGQSVIESGQRAEALQSQAFPDPTRPLQLQNPQALAQLTDMIMNGPMGFAQAGIFKAHTPKKPDPTVGTRFEREFLGGLAEKTPVKIEDLKGSSLMLMPWDLTNRNYRITSISDEMLANPFVTHGGQDYARDLTHILERIGGASNLGIARQVRNRTNQARDENLAMGGTGQVIPLPTTMGDYSEFFSVMPTQAIFGLLDARTPSKKVISEIDKSIRNIVLDDKKILKNFKGLMTEEGRIQLLTGEGLDTTAGKARTKVMERLALKGNQEKLGYNIEDLSAAITDPALAGVPKGYVGNTVLSVGQEGMHLRPSSNPSYNTDFTANYLGTLGQNVPAEVLMPKTFDRILQEMAGKRGNTRNIVLGTLEKRGKGISEMVDQQVIDNYYNYLESLNR